MTFNLTAALRLNDVSFSSGMRRANSSVRNFQTSAVGLTSKIAAVGAALGVTALAVKGLHTAFQGAMQMETDKLTLGALVNDTEKANKLFDMLQQKGMKSVFSDADFMGAGKAFLPVTKNLNEINNLLGLTERLASSNPLEGMEGASFAIREALSGDLVSLQERFNIPRSTLKQAFKGADTATEKIAALDKVLNQLGFTQEFVNKVNTSASAQWQTLKSNVTTALAKMGGAALEKLKKPLTEINEWAQNGGLNWIKEKGSDFLVSAVTKVIEFGTYIKDNWPTIKQKFIDFNNAIQPIKDGLALAFEGVKNVGSYIIDNWPLVKEAIIGVTVAVAAFKLGMIGLAVVGVITNLINLYRNGMLAATIAQWAMNTALLACPATWVVIAIAALIAIGVLLYRNWDTVKAKAMELWAKLGPLQGVILALIGPIRLLISAGIALKNNWSNVWSSVLSGAASAVNGVISKINALIKTINLIPGVNVPIIPKVSWGNTKSGSYAGGGTQSSSHATRKSFAMGLSNVPYNGYQATLHKGERVLTPEENDAYNRGKGGGQINITGNTFNVRKDSDIKDIAYQLAKLIEKEGAWA